MTSEARAKGANHEDRTSYETSKRLAGLGFDGKACGYWVDKLYLVRQGNPKLEGKSDWQWVDGKEVLDTVFNGSTTWQKSHPSYKAFSMHTLSLALQERQQWHDEKTELRIHPENFSISKEWAHKGFSITDPNPTEAMGLALIKVLEYNTEEVEK